MAYSINASTVLGKVKLNISNLERSLQFYQQVVGLQVLEHQGSSASLTADGVNVLIELEEIPNAIISERRTTTGLYHYALLLPNRETLGAALARLIASGIHIGQADHLVSEALYITDPDNNGIEIYADRPRSEWKKADSGDYMMANNPIDWDGLLAAADPAAATLLPAGTIIGHIHLHINSIPAARAFYNGLLGFDIVGDYTDFKALFVSVGGYHHHIGLNIWAGIGAPAPAASSTGLDYFTIVYPNQAERDIAINRLREAGTAIDESDGVIFATDPSSIRIKLAVAK
ncbi:VOC family protein [Paenibacillus sp. KS-LC4]|uniref:VOC family protein n=1 Tax=Paenibacillus sp. KS-LC4 TaxID=2979727 RepID=UPI0030D3A6DC